MGEIVKHPLGPSKPSLDPCPPATVREAATRRDQAFSRAPGSRISPPLPLGDVGDRLDSPPARIFQLLLQLPLQQLIRLQIE